MSDDAVVSHLRAALEAVAAREEERVTSILSGADRRHEESVRAMAPVLKLLVELQGLMGDHPAISFTLPDGGASATIATGAAASSNRLRITFEPESQRYRIERTETYYFADGGFHSTVTYEDSPEGAVQHAVEIVGSHLGSERAHQARTRVRSASGLAKPAKADSTYQCRLLSGGTGSAGPCLGPMIASWGRAHGYSVFPGTLNLCADRPVVVPEANLSLEGHEHLAQPEWRRTSPGFSPRLYPVVVGESQDAWLYRWSAPEQLRAFVGDADGCSAEHRCEIVAEVRLRDALELREGEGVTLRFRS